MTRIDGEKINRRKSNGLVVLGCGSSFPAVLGRAAGCARLRPARR